MEWFKAIAPLLVSWPVVVLIAVILLRKPLVGILERLGGNSETEAEFGPLKIRLGALAQEGEVAVSRLHQINEVLADSRLLELEITSEKFGGGFNKEQRERLNDQIARLQELVDQEAQQTASGDAAKPRG